MILTVPVFVGIFSGCLAVLLLLSAALCCLCRCIRRKPTPKAGGDTKLTTMTEKSAPDPEIAPEKPPKPHTTELSLENIAFKEELGEGQFGKFRSALLLLCR